MKNYTTENPSFQMFISLPEETDPAHADIVSKAPKQLLENTLKLKKDIDDVKISMENKLENEISLLKSSIITGINNNIFLEDFSDMESVKVRSGIYNPTLKKVYT